MLKLKSGVCGCVTTEKWTVVLCKVAVVVGYNVSRYLDRFIRP